jgi:hypothetical protein
MKKLFAIIGAISAIISVSISICAMDATTSEVYIPSENYTQEELTILIQENEERMGHAHTMAESARALGYDEEHPVIQLAKTEWETANTDYLIYLEKYAIIKQKEEKRMEEYPVATMIWNSLQEQGFNDYVCAGILGNIMTEVGGNTLEIKYWLTNPSNRYYGICQWSKKYNKEIQGGSLTEQLNYLKKTVKKEIDNFGHKYKKGFDYNDFMNLQDAEEAALAFAKAYERCNSKHYSVRLVNAEKAYKYFVG